MRELTEKEVEIASRKLCELRGIDPDERVAHGAEPDSNGFVCDVLLYSPAWELYRKEIIAFWQLHMSIGHALMERFRTPPAETPKPDGE